jgi:hypothetical protein
MSDMFLNLMMTVVSMALNVLPEFNTTATTTAAAAATTTTTTILKNLEIPIPKIFRMLS